jgi:hypothetical protein
VASSGLSSRRISIAAVARWKSSSASAHAKKKKIPKTRRKFCDHCKERDNAIINVSVVVTDVHGEETKPPLRSGHLASRDDQLWKACLCQGSSSVAIRKVTEQLVQEVCAVAPVAIRAQIQNR